jgi:indolepyruvate decarboxylase
MFSKRLHKRYGVRMADGVSISDYLIKRILDQGVRHVFGIPGDYVIGFFDRVSKSPLKLIVTSDEQGAGFAADAYARMQGLGVVCVTFSVGGLKLANTTAQAFAEKSPVLVISGAPGREERLKNPVLHHRVNLFSDQLRVFERLTTASAELSDPETAGSEIDRVLEAVLHDKRPGYLELPRDMIAVVPAVTRGNRTMASPVVSTGTLDEAQSEAAGMINAAERPVILAGVGVERHNLLGQTLGLARRGNIPLAATILGKSAIPEEEPLYMGVYGGLVGNEEVSKYVEGSDCVIMVGAYLSDLDLGSLTSGIDQGKIIHITADRVTIRHHVYPGLGFDLLEALAGAGLTRHEAGHIPYASRQSLPDRVAPDTPVSAEQVFLAVSRFLEEKDVLIADVGDSLFGTAEISLPCPFISSAYYASMGFGVPGAVGIQLACPGHRPVVITGDGAFQMTGMELSTAARYGLNPVVIVLNNGGYGTLRMIADGPFDDIHSWNYAKVPEVIGSGNGFFARTGQELEQALTSARGSREFSIIEVPLQRDDSSPCLRRLGMAIRRRL